MEKQLNKEYQKLIDKLNTLPKETTFSSEYFTQVVGEIKYAIEQLGSEPVLNKDTQAFKEITTKMLKLYIAKNKDYGNSFEQSLNKFGIVAGIVRMGDKMNRIESLSTKEAQVKEESIKDTLIDLANYAIMTLIWLNKQV
jgi:hypothetical protein